MGTAGSIRAAAASQQRNTLAERMYLWRRDLTAAGESDVHRRFEREGVEVQGALQAYCNGFSQGSENAAANDV